MTPEEKRYAKILKDIIGGKGIGKKDEAFFTDYTNKVDDTVLNKIKSSDEFKDYTGEDIDKALNDGYLQLSQSPEYKEKLLDFAQKTEQGKIAGQIRGALNLALSAGDIAMSSKQIREGEKDARNSRRPNRPSVLKADPLLAQAIEEARQGTFDTARRLAPAQQAILDNYLSDLNVARTASTGQAGTYGALGQAASNRRGRANLQLGAMADDVRAREQGRLDNLIGLKQQENQAIQQSAAQYYPTDIQQYQNEQQAAGALEATGRQNMRNSLLNLGQQVPDIASQLATKRRFDRLRMTDETYGTGGIAERADIIANQRANGTFDYSKAPDFISPELAEAYNMSPRRRY